ncbi:hypothetical protein RKD47_005329 [Streptomyces albogriseolus]
MLRGRRRLGGGHGGAGGLRCRGLGGLSVLRGGVRHRGGLGRLGDRNGLGRGDLRDGGGFLGCVGVGLDLGVRRNGGLVGGHLRLGRLRFRRLRFGRLRFGRLGGSRLGGVALPVRRDGLRCLGLLGPGHRRAGVLRRLGGDRRLGLRGLGFLSRSLLRRLGALGLRHGRATVRRLSGRRVLRLGGLRGHRRLHSALRSDSDARLLSGLRRLAGRGVPCLRGATRRRVPGRTRPRHDRRDLLAVRRRRPLALGGDRGADRLGGDPGDGRLGRVRRSRDRSRAARALGDPGCGLRCRRLACARDVEVLGAEGRRARLAGRQVGGAAVGEGADRARGQVGQRRAEVQRTARRGR